MHPLMASRVLCIYERKNPIKSALLSTLLDQGHDKVFRIEQFDSKFCEKVQRRVEVVVAACTLKVSELRAFEKEREKNLMALALGRPTIAGAGFNWNSSAIGSESGSGKEAAGGDGSAAPSSGSDFPRADPTLTRTPGAGESSGAGSSRQGRVSTWKVTPTRRRCRPISSCCFFATPAFAPDGAAVPVEARPRNVRAPQGEGHKVLFSLLLEGPQL